MKSALIVVLILFCIFFGVALGVKNDKQPKEPTVEQIMPDTVYVEVHEDSLNQEMAEFIDEYKKDKAQEKQNNTIWMYICIGLIILMILIPAFMS